MSPSDERATEAFHELVVTCAELGINVGLMMSVMSEWPDEVQDNFIEKMQTLVGQISREIREFQDFAEAYDR